jgi:hypothetical protein
LNPCWNISGNVSWCRRGCWMSRCEVTRGRITSVSRASRSSRCQSSGSRIVFIFLHWFLAYILYLARSNWLIFYWQCWYYNIKDKVISVIFIEISFVLEIRVRCVKYHTYKWTNSVAYQGMAGLSNLKSDQRNNDHKDWNNYSRLYRTMIQRIFV